MIDKIIKMVVTLYNLIDLDLIYIMGLGFIFTFITLYLMQNGNLGLNMQNKYYLYLSNKESFNKLLLLIIMFYLILTVSMSHQIILLDSTSTTFNLNGTVVTVKGEIIQAAFSNLGASGAFAVGAKIAHSIIAKSGMPLAAKLGTILGYGAGSSIAFTVSTNAVTSIFKDEMRRPQEVTFKIDKVEVTGNNGNNIVSVYKEGYEAGNTTAVESIKTIVNNSLGPTEEFSQAMSENIPLLEQLVSKNIFKIPVDQVRHSVNGFPSNQLQINTNINSNTTNKSTVIESLEKYTSRKLEDIFNNTVSTGPKVQKPTIINSPLEHTEVITLEYKVKLIDLLTNILSLQFVMLYLMLMLIFIFTMKIVSDKNLYNEYWESKVKSLPLGKYVHFVISKIIAGWRKSNVIWIYSTLFFLFIFMCCSTLGVYAVLHSLHSV